MTTNKGPAPGPLAPKVARKLLDLLSTDDAFRELFQADAHTALAQVGYEPPQGGPTAAQCLQLAPGAVLASKESIARDRERLEASLALPMVFFADPGLNG